MTPVYAAVIGGHLETVRALVREFGADARAANVEGYTPVSAAALGGHTACVRALVRECGADANTRNLDGITPVLVASFKGHTACVRALVQECDADLSAADFAGMTPVYAAAIGGHLETVRALVREFGADVNTPSSRDFTALGAAAHRGDAAMAWTLVRECGAELDRARQQRQAFAMALHARLGRGSRAHALDEHLLQMVLGPHVASGPPASELAAQEGHAATAGVLRFLEAHDGAAPEHAAANAARRADFECPVCLEPEVGGGALALVPCGHQVCRGCWG
jgi:ankyrin repeat protein